MSLILLQRFGYGLCLTLLGISLTMFESNTSFAANSPKLSFQQAMSEIMARSTSLSISESQLRATEKGNILERTAFLPTISYDYTENTFKTAGVGGRTNSTRSGLNASWNLFQFGADASEWKAAIQEEKKFESNVDNTYLTVEKSAVDALVNYIGQSFQVNVAKQLYDLNLDSHKIAKARFKRGLLPKQEVDKVFIDVENAKARWQDARIRLEEAAASLTELLGHTNVQMQWPWSNVLSKDSQTTKDLESGFSINSVPAWNVVNYEYESQDHLVSGRFRQFLPSLDAVGTYNFGGTNSTTNEYTASLTLSVPLFDGLSRYANYKTQVEVREQSELKREALRRSIEAEWTAARNAYRIALATATARANALEIARRIYRDNERRFRSGRISANDLSLDQERLFRAEQNAVVGWTTLHSSFTRICHAKGKRIQACLPSTKN